MQENENNLVSIAGCKSYHQDTIRLKFEELLEPWGGINYFVRPHQKVLLKPNLLAAAKPEEVVTTHPNVIRVLAELVQSAGGKVFIGDSPGSDDYELVYRMTGMHHAAKETNSELITFDHYTRKEYYGNRKTSELQLAAVLDEMDVVINVAKLKTHPLTGLTAAVKNTFGCIVGKKKARMHYEYPLPHDFSRMLIDVYLAVKPALSIIDAIIALEGIGPRKGKPRNTGLLMASPNAVALDRVAAELTGFRQDQVTTLTAAREKSLSGVNLPDIRIEGQSLNESRIDTFDKGTASGGKIGRLIASFPQAWLRGWLERRRPYPFIDEQACNSCGKCAEDCPAQIIIIEDGIPDIDLKSCIRCYCCREFCPRGAVNLK